MRIENFNHNWLFSNEIHYEGEKVVDLPHDAMLTERRLKGMQNGAAAGFFPGGRYVYKKTFWGDEEYRNKAVYLEFDGVYMNSKVYINDQMVGGWIYGYTKFRVELTDRILIGSENEIKVTVDNSQTPNSRWYTGSGIYRDVNLYLGNKKHIELDGVRITTLSCNPAVIQITTKVTPNAQSGRVAIELYEIHIDGKEELVLQDAGADCILTVPDAKLWDAEQPNRYIVKIKLEEDGLVIDEQTVTTGIRLLEWNASKGLQVNGKTTKLRGGCIHHDNGIVGACAHRKVEFRKAKILKKAGFNAIRSAHNPISKAMLDACDEIGLYVMDESFDQWRMSKTDYDYALYFDDEWQKDMKAMILKDCNHPSVIIYSIGNEIADTGNQSGVEISRMLHEYCKELDESRPTVNGINPVVSNMGGMINSGKATKDDVVDPYEEKPNAQATASLLANMIATAAPFISKIMGKPKKVEKLLKSCFDEVDIVGYNYADQCYKLHHEWNEERIMVGTETYPQSVAKRWPMINNSSYIIGDFMWTAIDYLGEAGVGVPIYGKKSGGFNRPYPCISGGCGVIDLIGHMETEGYYAAIAWGQYSKPYIAVRPINRSGEKHFFGAWRGTDAIGSWSWKGMEGRLAEIEVYSQGAHVELFRDEVSLGIKELIDCVAKYETTYNHGMLKAVSYDELGQVIEQDILRSADEDTCLTVDIEEANLKADGDDLTFVSVTVTDKKGIVKMLEDRQVSVQVSGVGVLAGIGSGNPVTEESFVGNQYMTWFGRMGFYVRSTGESGTAKIEVMAEGLDTQTMEIIFV